MSFLSKVELKKQLKNLGIKVEGNYVRKSDINKALKAISRFSSFASKGRPSTWKAQDLYKKLSKLNSEDVDISYDDDEGMYKVDDGKDTYFLNDTEGEKFEKLWGHLICYLGMLRGHRKPR